MSRLSFTHPNREQLLAWLDGAAENESVITMHVDRCDRCASRLDVIARGRGDQPGADDAVDVQLADAIREVYEPPADLNQRVMKKIDERERADRELNLFLGLFAIGKDAAELMLPPDDTGEEV